MSLADQDWVSPVEMFDDALSCHLTNDELGAVNVLASDGSAFPLALKEWCAPADATDRQALDELSGELPPGATVLDLACGPGRHSAYLSERGLAVLGVDISPAAVAVTGASRAAAITADILGPLPGHRSWDGILLLDGNVGLSGDPRRVLRRTSRLLAPGGCVLVELDPDEITDSRLFQLCDGRRRSSPFPWARVGTHAIAEAAGNAGMTVARSWSHGCRQFALLARAIDMP